MKPAKIITIYSFFVCIFLMLAGIISAKNSSELFNSFIFLPLIFYFSIRLLHQYRVESHVKAAPARRRPNKTTTLTVEQKEEQSPEAIEPEIVADVPDNNKRLFLKLIGSAGISMLLMALFTKKAQASFFGSAPVGPGVVGIKDIAGNKIDPAEKRPTDGYEISNIEDTGNPQYYGFVKKTGEWYILKNDSGAFRYAKGSSLFSASWAIRGSLTYDYFNNVFG